MLFLHKWTQILYKIPKVMLQLFERFILQGDPNITFSSICCWFPNCPRDQTRTEKSEVKHAIYVPEVP